MFIFFRLLIREFLIIRQDFIFKPKTKGNDSLDDYDYGEEDSEEWETEDEEVLEDGFEGSDPNEERDRAD